jgi:hypothetical protein
MYKINNSWKKYNIKNNLLEKGWAKKQPFISEASKKKFQAKQIEPKNNLLLAKKVRKG